MNAIKQLSLFEDVVPAVQVVPGPLPKDVMTEKKWKKWGYKIDPREYRQPVGHIMINAIYYALYDFYQVDIINKSNDAMRRRAQFERYYFGEVVEISEVV